MYTISHNICALNGIDWAHCHIHTNIYDQLCTFKFYNIKVRKSNLLDFSADHKSINLQRNHILFVVYDCNVLYTKEYVSSHWKGGGGGGYMSGYQGIHEWLPGDT